MSSKIKTWKYLPTIDIEKYTIAYIYQPHNINFEFTEPDYYIARQIKFVIEDFNNHSTFWGYTETNEDENEEWAK